MASVRPSNLGLPVIFKLEKNYSQFFYSLAKLHSPFPENCKGRFPCMSPYSLLLSASHYTLLMRNAAPGSDAHSALMRALPPATDGHRGLTCNAKAIEELLDLAVRVCPDAVLEISRQIQNQLPPHLKKVTG